MCVLILTDFHPKMWFVGEALVSCLISWRGRNKVVVVMGKETSDTINAEKKDWVEDLRV